MQWYLQPERGTRASESNKYEDIKVSEERGGASVTVVEIPLQN